MTNTNTETKTLVTQPAWVHREGILVGHSYFAQQEACYKCDRALLDRQGCKGEVGGCLFTLNQCPSLPVAVKVPKASDVEMKQSVGFGRSQVLISVEVEFSLVVLVGSQFVEAPGMQPMADHGRIRTSPSSYVGNL